MNNLELFEESQKDLIGAETVIEETQQNPFILLEQENTPEEGVHAFFGVKLDALIDRSFTEKPNHEAEIAEQVKLLTPFMSGETGQSVQLRYIAHPHRTNWMLGKLDIALIFHTEGESTDSALSSALRFWEEIKPNLVLLAKKYQFSPITEPLVLKSIHTPFEIEDILEVARREEIVNLNGREGFFLVCPFLPTGSDLSRLCRGLLLHPHPVVFSVTVRPVQLTKKEQDYFYYPLVRRSLASHPGVGAVSLEGGKSHEADSKGLGLLQIHLASSHKIQASVLDLVGSEITRPGGSPEVDKDLFDRSHSGGYASQRAFDSETKSQAIKTLVYHDICHLLPSIAPAGLERLRYLVDPIQAGLSFRLPVFNEKEQLAGIAVKSAIPLIASRVSTEGIKIGESRYGAVSTEIRLAHEDRRKHCYLVGATGSGKTTLMLNMAIQDMNAGDGVIVMDFHGDLCHDLLKRVPPSRIDDLIYFNPADTDYPIGLNLLSYDRFSPLKDQQKERIIDFFITYLKRQYDSSTIGPFFFQSCRNGFHLVMANDEEPATLLDFLLVFIDEKYMRQKLSKMPFSLARRFWEEIYSHKHARAGSDNGVNMLQYIISKMSPLVDMALSRNIVGQTVSKLDFRAVLDQKKILLCNFSKGLIGNDFAELLSFVTLFKIEEAALSRADMPEDKRARCFLYIDECQNLQTEHFPQLLSEMRKYGVNITLGNQYFAQLNKNMQSSILSNAGTLVIFRSGVEDAKLLEPVIYPYDKRLILRQSNFNAVVKTLVDGNVSLFTIETLPMETPVNSDEAVNFIINSSRLNYGTKREKVEEDILAKLTWKPVEEKKPVKEG
jgi:hypothetical protein